MRYHKATWDLAAAALNPCHLSSSQDLSTGGTVSLLSSSLSSKAPPPPSHHLSITESMYNKQHYVPSPPVVMQLNSHLAKLLVVLRYHLVGSTSYRQLIKCTLSRWQIPSNHFCSKKAIPAMYNHVEEKVGHSCCAARCTPPSTRRAAIMARDSKQTDEYWIATPSV